jgi:hypothetical protein
MPGLNWQNTSGVFQSMKRIKIGKSRIISCSKKMKILQLEEAASQKEAELENNSKKKSKWKFWKK